MVTQQLPTTTVVKSARSDKSLKNAGPFAGGITAEVVLISPRMVLFQVVLLLVDHRGR